MKITIDEVKIRLGNVFGEKYEFDFSDYTTTHGKIRVMCPQHGWSYQIVKNLFKGHGCKKCSNFLISEKNKKNFDEVLSQFEKIHGDKYDYSKFIYNKNRIDSIIICKIHGEFRQSAWTHIKGHGCPSCSGNRRFLTNDYIKMCNEMHNHMYDYQLVNYKNMHSKVKIICHHHGEFSQHAQSHLRGSGCPKCNQSKGEKIVERFLIQNNIHFIPQKKFDECRHINHLIFDFFLPDHNTCIESNGSQHYQSIDIFGGMKNFKKNLIRDKIKEDFCREKNIDLIVIKHDRKHTNIEEIIMKLDGVLFSLRNKEL